ncbi:MAG TPA: tetratricopeptide repeat protein, partial [Spirochaetia bacterium]
MRHAAALVATIALLLAACSTAPKQSDTVTTVRNQADQDGQYGEAYLKQGRYQLALQFFTQSLSEYTSIDYTDGIVKSYNAIGLTYLTMGSLDMAEDILQRARSRAGAASPSLAFTTLLNLGELYLARGDARKAMDVLGEAAAMPATSRTEAQEAILLHDTGTAQRDLGDSAGAIESYGKALKINLARKLFEMAASDHYMIASVHSRDGRYEEA